MRTSTGLSTEAWPGYHSQGDSRPIWPCARDGSRVPRHERQHCPQKGSEEVEPGEMERPLRQRVRQTWLYIGGPVHRGHSWTMITAIDTNILLDILIPNDEFCGASAEALEEAVSNGSIAMPFRTPTRSAFRL